MSEWFKVIASVVVVVVSAILGRAFYLLDKKADKVAMDEKFDDIMDRIEQQQQMTEKHMDSCDRRQERQQKTLEAIREHAAQTEKSIAVLAARFEK